MNPGTLHGLRVIEMAGIGPAPFCGMLLADMGAEVIVIERPAALRIVHGGDALNRGKRSICLDLKKPLALQAVLQLIDGADALIEGYRPGVMERLAWVRRLSKPATRSSSTAESPAGARPGRSRMQPGTTSTTWR